jgi:hypothetical protein
VCRIRRLEHDGLGPELAEEATQRLADQHMIVDDKDLHRKPRSVPKTISVPGRKHESDLWRISGRQYFRRIQREGARAHNRGLNISAALQASGQGGRQWQIPRSLNTSVG